MYKHHRLIPARGADRDRHERGMGCGGRGSVGRASLFAGRSSVSEQRCAGRTALLPAPPKLRRKRTKPGEAPWRRRVAYGKTVWSRRPLLAPSPRRQVGLNRAQARPSIRVTTVTRRIRLRGRARHKPSNHRAGNAGLPPLNLYARVRFLCALCTRDRGCSAHPAFPAPSSIWRDSIRAKLGQFVPREGERTPLRGALAAICPP